LGGNATRPYEYGCVHAVQSRKAWGTKDSNLVDSELSLRKGRKKSVYTITLDEPEVLEAQRREILSPVNMYISIGMNSIVIPSTLVSPVDGQTQDSIRVLHSSPL